MTPGAAILDIWREMMTPSARGERPFLSLLIAVAHAVLGAALWPLASGLVAGARLAAPALYWLIKERADLKRGGGVRDGMIDAAMVGLGAFYGAGWWPAAILSAAVLAAILTSATR